MQNYGWYEATEFLNVFSSVYSTYHEQYFKAKQQKHFLPSPFWLQPCGLLVMGDYRSTSVDSRNSVAGCVAQEQIVEKILFLIWTLAR